MELIAGVLSSEDAIRPVPIQVDRTFNTNVEFLTTFCIEGTFLQLKGKQSYVCSRSGILFYNKNVTQSWTFLPNSIIFALHSFIILTI